MNTRLEITGFIRALTGTALMGALLLVAAPPVAAQEGSIDPRWQSWLGCWQPLSEPGSKAADANEATALLCVTPATESSAISIATIVDGEAVSHTVIDASGSRNDVVQDECTGWESARWSASGNRVYLRSEFTCPGEISRSTNGVLAITEGGEWLDIQGITAGAHQGVQVVRYKAVSDSETSPTATKAGVTRGQTLAVSTARLAAAAPLTTDDVIEAAELLDPAVVVAWLAEVGQPFGTDAEQLIALDEAGVPADVVDMMVALSFPRIFAIDPGLNSAEFMESAHAEGQGALIPATRRPADWSSYGYPPYGFGYGLGYGYSRYGYGMGYGSGFGYGYGSGYGWYDRPMIILVRPSEDAEPRQPVRRGRVVNGRGYSRGDQRQDTRQPATPAARDTRPTRVRTPDASSTGNSSAGSSSDNTRRTAKPRPGTR